MRKISIFAFIIFAFLFISSCEQGEKAVLLPFNKEPVEAEPVNIEVPQRTIDYDDPNWATDCWIIDLDTDFPMIYIDPTSKESTLSSIKDYFEFMKARFAEEGNPSVTDIALCVYEQSSIVPTESDAITWMYEKCLWTEENGFPVDYTKKQIHTVSLEIIVSLLDFIRLIPNTVLIFLRNLLMQLKR